MTRSLLLPVIWLLSFPGVLGAENITLRPTLLVAPQATVKGERILLGDVAKIFSPEPGFSGLVAQLKKIDLGESPPPKTTTTLVGASILAAVTAEGIPADALGYSVPQTVVVQREGREVTNAEVLGAARREITRDRGFDLQVREVSWANAQVIPAGKTDVSVVRIGEPAAGRMPLRVDVSVDGQPAARFVANAAVDDWREVPVLSRAVQRGSLISSDDIQLVRLNLLKQPADVAFNLQQIVGKRVKSDMAPGNTVRKSLLDIPPAIPRGQKVKMVYRSGAFEATATGVTLEDGFDGARVRVRNESSKRIVEAEVVGPDEVRVRAE